MKTHWVSLNFWPAIKPLWYVKGGTGTLRGGGRLTSPNLIDCSGQIMKTYQTAE